jgi:hypothetical protein
MRSENRKLAERFNCTYKTGPGKGLYANRNFTAKHCKGTHIRTMDDDHTFPEGHMSICLKKIHEDPDSVWILGEWYPNESQDKPTPYCPGEIHPRGYSTKPKDEQNCKAISCGASIYPRTIIDKNILNVEYFRFGYTYLEYGCRLNHLGFRIRHLNETFVYHEYYFNPPSFNNQVAVTDSKIFAMMALSFLYQPTLKNKFFTIAQLGVWFIKSYKPTKESILNNISRIKELKKDLKQYNFI